MLSFILFSGIQSLVGEPDKELQKLEEWQNCDADVEWQVTSNLRLEVHEWIGNLLLNRVHSQGLIVDV